MTVDRNNNLIQEPDVIIKFHNDIVLPYTDHLEEFIKKHNLAPWQELEEKFPGISLKRVYKEQTPEFIQNLEDKAAENNPEYQRPYLLHYFELESTPDTNKKELAAAINDWKIVEFAYAPLRLASLPNSPTSTIQAIGSQEYLDAAPLGLGVLATWPLIGADGENINFIDIERDWRFDHDEFLANPGNPISSVFSIADTGSVQSGNDIDISHGTSILGVVGAPDVDSQIIGVAFKSNGKVVSTRRTSDPSVDNIHEAIMSAVSFLGEGDVLLIEAQLIDSTTHELWPVELNILEFNEISTVVSGQKITVIEAGGNGDNDPLPIGTIGMDLDQKTDGGIHIFDRSLPNEYRESGAIMVGSATKGASPLFDHNRMARTIDNKESNFGNRIDCYAWGEKIFTAGGPDPNDYDALFGGTSGASAIIAGVALAVQGVAKENNLGSNSNGTFNPKELREILGSYDPLTNQPWRRTPPQDDPPFGTRSSDPMVDMIGVMPDLQKIFTSNTTVNVDVYMRDNTTDDGSGPSTGSLTSSPDIIARNSQVANFDNVFGENSPDRDVAGLGEDIIKPVNSSDDRYIYVRVINRGTAPAAGVSVNVYWSKPSTYLGDPDQPATLPAGKTPQDYWLNNLIGTATFLPIPGGEKMQVAEIEWSANNIPPAGNHYCFISIVDHPIDSAPDPTGIKSVSDYKNLIRNENNMAWCNFNVIPMSATSSSAAGGAGAGEEDFGELGEMEFGLPFFVTGSQFDAAEMTLEVAADFPPEVKIYLEGRISFLTTLFRDETVIKETGHEDIGRATIALSKDEILSEPDLERSDEEENIMMENMVARHFKFPSMVFPKNMDEGVRFVVDIPFEFWQGTYELNIRQIHENDEVGRITWRLVPPGEDN